MIQVSVVGGELVAGRQAPLSIRFANTGRGACANLVFRLSLPAGIALRAGSDRVELPVLPAGRTHTHEVSVQPRHPGRFVMTSKNFSYRDEYDMPVRVTDLHLELRVAAPPPPISVRQPTGRLDVSYVGGDLERDAWDRLQVMVTNRTGVPLDEVTMAVSGPFESDGKRHRPVVLAAGEAARFTFHVKATDAGRHVPATVHLTYSHPDSGGATVTRTQNDSIHLVVRPAGSGHATAPSPPSEPARETVLYLSASPRDMSRLRSDGEMRKVKERLQLSKHRERFRIEPSVAARFDDISQALVDHQPHVIHFSGHGTKRGGLWVENEYGYREEVTPEGVADLFGEYRATVRCVILNACYSAVLAQALTAKIDYVIGMRGEIGDEAAIEFSVGFYTSLFGGRSVPQAFRLGKTHIRRRAALEREHLTPLLYPPGSEEEEGRSTGGGE